jgi:ABC-type nitrate/sulfonate/bicarbonate transport system permease component
MLGVLALVALWWLIAANTISARVPSPAETLSAILADFWEVRALEHMTYSRGGIADHLAYTFKNVVSAVAAGTVAGVIFGIVISRARYLRALLEAPLLFMGTIPVVMLLPFFTMWFGTSTLAQNGLVLFYTFMTVALAARIATLNISGYYENYALSLGATQPQFLGKVILPAIIPEVLGTVRVSLAAGWGFETVVEILGAPSGAGRLIQAFSVAVMTPNMFGVLICIGVLAVIVDAVVVLFGSWIVRWKE